MVAGRVDHLVGGVHRLGVGCRQVLVLVAGRPTAVYAGVMQQRVKRPPKRLWEPTNPLYGAEPRAVREATASRTVANAQDAERARRYGKHRNGFCTVDGCWNQPDSHPDGFGGWIGDKLCRDHR